MRAHEWVFQVQLVNAAHERQICGTDWLGQIIRAASTDAGQLGLMTNRKCVVYVYHRFALSSSTEVCAPSKKSCASRQFPDLGVQHLQINGWLRSSVSSTKRVGRPFAQLLFPLGNLVGGELQTAAPVRPASSPVSPRGISRGSRFFTYRLVQILEATRTPALYNKLIFTSLFLK